MSIVMAGLALGAVAWGEDRFDLIVATTMGLTTLSLMHIVAAIEARETTGTIFTRYTLANRRFVLLIGVAAAATLLVTELSFLQRIFDTTSLTSSQWGICLLGPIIYVAIVELMKLIDRHRGQPEPVLTPAEA
jgi:Ca2+-transporting ATPase